jgi:hypothetical protein
MDIRTGPPHPEGLTCLPVRWLQTQRSLVIPPTLSTGQGSHPSPAELLLLAAGWSSGRGSSEAEWRAGRKANGKRAKVILKNSVGNPVTGEVTERVLTFILWKHLPLISA